jgi:hypothetical protein
VVGRRDDIHVGVPSVAGNAGGEVISAPVTLEGRRHEIWYRVRGAPPECTADTFLAATLLPSMAVGGALHLSAAVSPRLLAAIPTIQDIFLSWKRDLHRVPVYAPARELEPSGGPTGVGCFFSAGVDSWYSVLKRQQELSHLIFIHGFDIRLEESGLRARAAETIRGIARSLGKHLIEVETNLREFSDTYTSWDDFHGAALASVAHILAPVLRKIYVPAAHSYRVLLPSGTHPLLDPLWSSEGVDVAHDGCEATRPHKIARIAASKLALQSLRVCWEDQDGGTNCGRCRKCVNTMVGLRLAGALDRCPTFRTPLNLRTLSHLPADSERARYFLTANLEAAQESGRDPTLTQALRDALDRRYYKGLWAVARTLRSFARRFRRTARPPN